MRGQTGLALFFGKGGWHSLTFPSYTWDVYGHVSTIATPPNGSTTSAVVYDANGNKVEENVSGVIHEYVSAFGVTAQMTGSTENSTVVPLPGGVQALYSAGTLQRFRYPDWQGTIRAESNPSTRAFTESLAYAPFGERYALKGAPYNVDSFTGKPDQLVSDEYDFPAREEHNGQGRWISPDPTRDTGNKYVYADNNPLSNVDLYGLYSVAQGMEATVQTWIASELSQPDPLLESHGMSAVQTGSEAFGVSEDAYLARVDSASEEDVSVEDPPRLQRAIAEDADAKGQPVQEAQNQSQTQTQQNQQQDQQQPSSAGSTRTPAKGPPDTTVNYPGDKPGTGTDRTYGPDGRAVKDVDTGHDHGAGDPHAHDWDWSGAKPQRGPGRPLTPEEGGPQQRTILDWANDHKGAIITGTVVIGVGAAIVFTGGAAAPALALAAF